MADSSKIKTAVFVGILVVLSFVVGHFSGRRTEQIQVDDRKSSSASPHTTERHPEKIAGVVAVEGESGHLRLNQEVVNTLKVKVSPVRRAPLTEPLLLTGSLFLDSSSLAVVHSRFPGEIVKVGQIAETDAHGAPVLVDGKPLMRQIRAGDEVTKGQLIAVVWSKEIGETKSDLVEALSRRFTSEATVKRLEGLEKGSVSGQVVREAQQKYQSDMIAVERAERTLRSWRETEEEIAEVYAEAERIRNGVSSPDSKVPQTWADVEIRSPLSGTVLERNGTVGEIVATGEDLFTIADLSRMGVLANIYEEDIHKLTELTPEQRTWKVQLKAEPESPPILGRFEVIGHVIDPSQHTAAVVGWIQNPGRRLRTGQFITATIDLPGPTDAVLVPNSSIIDEGSTATVFVASDAAMLDIRARHVSVIRRGRDYALIQQSPPARGELHAPESLQEGELVITSGNLELFGFLQDQPTSVGAR